MTQDSQMTPNEKPAVDIRNCRVRMIGSYIAVCMVNTLCIFAEAYPPNLKLCTHPLRKQIHAEDNGI
jgi:hypothetical protein